ncbi:MAG: N-acetylmuramoyl-L-alanine amidase [Candidatus Neomarinimicrobiota bacterium]|tara:strand:+ start:52 stop:1209 length:1158 start_codon:yes stop_codon:yes gene_type:complete
MKLFQIKSNFLILYLFTSISFGDTNNTIKLVKNNQLLSKIDTIENNNFFSINDFLSSIDTEPYISEKTEKVVFYLENKKIKITNGIAFLLIDDNIYQLSSKVIKRDNEYFVNIGSFIKIINSSFQNLSIMSNSSEIIISSKSKRNNTPTNNINVEKNKWKFSTIIIDPGHGGKDPGAVGYRGTLEKDIALDVAKRLEKKISKNMKVKTVLTRDEDIFLKLGERTKIANENNGSLFISIHANAATDRRASGFETFLIGPNKNAAAVRVAARENAVLELEGSSGKKLTNEDLIKATIAQSAFASKSEKFAALVQEEISKRVQGKNRGVKQAGFYVLMGASMPNVLVELGFISNLAEEKKLRSSQYREVLATSIFRALEKYEKTLDND